MASRSSRKGKNRRKKKFVFIVLCFIFILGGIGYYIMTDQELQKDLKKFTESKPSLKIVDENSKSRPIAVMIDTSDAGRANHTGLQDAFLTYEIITEGGITRMMALFKDQDTSLVGPVRSSRHYFLDYAMENDAIYAHFGWSDRAKEDIYALDIDNLNGITNASKAYFRDENLYAPHNVFTKISNLETMAKEKDYPLETEKGLLLNYSVKEISLKEEENARVANKVTIPFSYYHTTEYEYHPDTKTYYRSINEEVHTDANTKEQYHVKNILLVKIKNVSFDDYGRQDLENIGSGEGYFITNGYAIPITWSKESRSSKTIYKKISGEEIQVNDGNTAIEIEPITETPTINE